MSTGLAAQLGTDSLDDSLAEIDSWSKDLDATRRDYAALGPFGVLKRVTGLQSHTTDVPVETGDITNSPILDTQSVPSFDPWVDLDDSLQWADLFELNFDYYVATGQNNSDQNFVPYHFPASSYDIQILPSSDVQGVSDTLTSSATTAPTNNLVEAQPLLKHFQDHVIPSMAGLPFGSKSPWKIFKLSTAVQTMAELTFLGKDEIKHANLANFFGILACSAYHLANDPSSSSMHISERWANTVQVASKKSKAQVQKSLQSESQGPK
jgi:arginine metabolism regulation protein II